MAIGQVVVDDALWLVTHLRLIGLEIFQVLDLFDLWRLNADQAVLAIKIDRFSRVPLEIRAVVEWAEVRIDSGEFASDRLA